MKLKGFLALVKLITLLSTAADKERNLLINSGAALNTLLHDRGTVLTRHHVETRLEQHIGCIVRAPQTIS